MHPQVGQTLLESVAVLEELGVRYAVVGGLAVSVWSVPRATRDVDLYAELSHQLQPRLEAELRRRGFDVPAMVPELEKFGVFRSKLVSRRVFLDIFDAVGPLGSAILERRQQVAVLGRDIWFVSPEDLAVLKAFSDRPRDNDDLVSLLAMPEGTLDVGYIEYWAKLLDESIGGTEVTENLAEARRKAERRR